MTYPSAMPANTTDPHGRRRQAQLHAVPLEAEVVPAPGRRWRAARHAGAAARPGGLRRGSAAAATSPAPLLPVAPPGAPDRLLAGPALARHRGHRVAGDLARAVPDLRPDPVGEGRRRR